MLVFLCLLHVLWALLQGQTWMTYSAASPTQIWTQGVSMKLAASPLHLGCLMRSAYPWNWRQAVSWSFQREWQAPSLRHSPLCVPRQAWTHLHATHSISSQAEIRSFIAASGEVRSPLSRYARPHSSTSRHGPSSAKKQESSTKCKSD